MKRHWVYALAALLALPCAAQAQGDPGWGPKVRITPFIALSPGFSQEGIVTVGTASSVSDRAYQLEHGSSVSFGLNAEYLLWDRFAVIAGGLWSSRGQGRLIDWDEEVVYPFEGTTLWMAKAGLAMRLREVRPDVQMHRLNASIYVAPAFIHDAAKVSLTTPAESQDAINHWGLNLGAEAELPLTNERLSFTAALEDWMIFWDETKYSTRVGGYYREFDPDLAVAVDPDNSHVVIFRLGLTYRF